MIGRVNYFIGQAEFDCAWVVCYNCVAMYFIVNEIMRIKFYRVSRIESPTIKHSIFRDGTVSCPRKECHILLLAVTLLKSEYLNVQVRITSDRRLNRGTRYQSFPCNCRRCWDEGVLV